MESYRGALVASFTLVMHVQAQACDKRTLCCLFCLGLILVLACACVAPPEYFPCSFCFILVLVLASLVVTRLLSFLNLCFLENRKLALKDFSLRFARVGNFR